MKVPHPNSAQPKMADGTGTNSPTHLTGHGAPASASGRGNEPMPGGAKMIPDNWGAKSLSKLRAPFVAGGAASVGFNRFVQPTNADTAQVPPPGLGNPRN